MIVGNRDKCGRCGTPTYTDLTKLCHWCSYQWLPRVPEPRVCPRCHNPLGQQRKRPYQPRAQKAE